MGGNGNSFISLVIAGEGVGASTSIGSIGTIGACTCRIGPAVEVCFPFPVSFEANLTTSRELDCRMYGTPCDGFVLNRGRTGVGYRGAGERGVVIVAIVSILH